MWLQMGIFLKFDARRRPTLPPRISVMMSWAVNHLNWS